MPNYCVNKNAQPTGEHEVHNLDVNCKHLPEPINRLNLGWHPNCQSALRKAKESYSNVDGCAYCCPECNTR